uniref:Mitochondrial carrier protein n=1 Tax=Arcella intermedia TaxID=1963864 RepID=A0A6B2LER9_9EUKA
MYPLDTLKTRMQAEGGFWKAGGFKRIYSGVWAAAGGSAPGAALFFGSYEYAKMKLERDGRDGYKPLIHMAAASVGECAACLVRVPTENVKQKMQAKLFPTTKDTILNILKVQGPTGFYVGYFTTLMREIPFALIQFPIYEKLKSYWSKQQSKATSPLQSALCGSIAGAFAAGLTTPMDVVKTRLMLGMNAYSGPLDVVRNIIEKEGIGALYSGVGPRVLLIGVGGYVFFGAFESAKSLFTSFTHKK